MEKQKEQLMQRVWVLMAQRVSSSEGLRVSKWKTLVTPQNVFDELWGQRRERITRHNNIAVQ